MHPANQRPGKPDKLSQGAHKQISYPRVQWGNALHKRGNKNHRVAGNRGIKREGNVRSRKNQEYRTTHAAGS